MSQKAINDWAIEKGEANRRRMFLEQEKKYIRMYIERLENPTTYSYLSIQDCVNSLDRIKDQELIEYKNEQYKKLEARLKIKNTIKQKLSVFKNIKPTIYGCFCVIILLIFLVIYTE